MADNAILFKLVAKSVGMKYGIMPTFMAKPWGDVSQVDPNKRSNIDDTASWVFGVSWAILNMVCAKLRHRHIHVSLRDKSGRNIFGLTDEETKGGGRKNAAFDDVKFISQEAEWFLAGLLDGLSDGEYLLRILLMAVVPMMCPTINSYKRLLGGAVSVSLSDHN